MRLICGPKPTLTRDRAAVVEGVDRRVVEVAEHLVTAALLWMQKADPCAALGKVHCPKGPTKQQFLEHLTVTHPQHVWQVQPGKACCTNCRLLLRSNMSQARLKQCASQQCIGAGSATVPVGHPSHLLKQEGLSWKCVFCSKRTRTAMFEHFRLPCRSRQGRRRVLR